MLFLSNVGSDTVFGGPGNDSIMYDFTGGGHAIYGEDGNDSIFGGAGSEGDTISGGTGNDVIEGFFGADLIDGGPGDDLITGGVLSAGPGAFIEDDHIVFATDSGNDEVINFEIDAATRAPINHIVLQDGDAADVAAVVAGASSNAAGDAVLHYGSATMTLVDVDFTFLTGDYFLLG
jgi:Ca2+-binding RTX toxin-like protein